MSRQRSSISALFLSLVLAGGPLAAGCSKSGSDCDAVVDHTVSLLPENMQAKIKEGRADAIGKCEKVSPEARKCVLAAASMQDLMKCPRE
jgi:hypothetical protein